MSTSGKFGILGVLALSILTTTGAVRAAETIVATPPVATPAAQPSALLGDLQTGFASASAAKACFEAYAAKATEEGYLSVAALFKTGAMSEGIHAKKFAAAITKLGGKPAKAAEAKPITVLSTKENLEAALKGEIAANASSFPGFAKLAETEKNIPAMYAFKGALAAEVEFVKMAQSALADLAGWKAAGKVFLVCEICGYPTLDGKIAKCPVCSAPRSKFEEIK